MHEKVSALIGVEVVSGLVKSIQDAKAFLSDVDGLIGDGDHGINMNKGFTICGERLNETYKPLSAALKLLGTVLLTEIGGSMGPIYGSFFRGLAKGCAGAEEIDCQVFSKMLHGGADGIQSISSAQRGDKTCLDCLLPAVDAYDAAVEAGKSFSDALREMMAAAEKGMESTKDMVAKIGRSSRLGERSRGVLDAGSASCNIILQSLGNQFISYLSS